MFHSIQGDDEPYTSKVGRSIVTKLRILLNYFQVMSGIVVGIDVKFPSNYEEFMGSVTFVNLDIVAFFAAGCLYSPSFYGELVAVTMIPIFITAVLFFRFILLSFQILLGGQFPFIAFERKLGMEAFVRIQTTYFTAFIILCYIMFPSVTSKILRTFSCEDFDDGHSYLRADYSIDCDTAQVSCALLFMIVDCSIVGTWDMQY